MVFELQKRKLTTRAAVVRVAIAAFLILQMSVSAAAVEQAAPFHDVSARHQYYAVINDAVEEKIVSGVGGGAFEPDRTIAFEEFVCMFGKKVSETDIDAVSGDSWKSKMYNAAKSMNLISLYESKIQAKMTCSIGELIPRIFDSLNLRAYDCELWGVDRPSGYSIYDGNALVSAKEYGFFENINFEDYTHELNRGGALQLIYNIAESITGTLPVPDIVSTVEVSFEQEDEWDYNKVYKALKKLPSEYLTLWNSVGWDMSVTTTPISELRPSYSSYTKAVGITSANNREMIFQHQFGGVSPHTVLHEFGHFMAYQTTNYPTEIFSREKEAIEDFFRSYAASSKDEAFGDLFAYCVLNVDDSEAMALLKETLPLSYRFMKAAYPEIWR